MVRRLMNIEILRFYSQLFLLPNYALFDRYLLNLREQYYFFRNLKKPVAGTRLKAAQSIAVRLRQRSAAIFEAISYLREVVRGGELFDVSWWWWLVVGG